MNRRQFTAMIGTGVVGLGLEAKSLSSARPPKPDRPSVAITMDDFSWNQSLKLSPQERNWATLKALKSHGNLKAALFVKGKNVDNETGKALLGEWDKAGHMIGNHSYTHQYLNSAKVNAENFNADILKAEGVLRNFSRFQKSFRFPYLKEGESALERDAVRTFLRQHGYRIGHVTIDASDWAVDSRLTKRLAKDPAVDLKPYRDFYLAHMWERALYYDGLSRTALGRSVKHTLLVHFNLLNALFLGDLLDMFKNKGWKLIDAEDAFKDSVFAAEPNIVPAGESIVWALAKESGRFESLLRYPGEDSQYEDAKMDKLNL